MLINIPVFHTIELRIEIINEHKSQTKLPLGKLVVVVASFVSRSYMELVCWLGEHLVLWATHKQRHSRQFQYLYVSWKQN